MLKNKEIAEILNISPAAVSLALNNKCGVSEETRRKVFALRNGSIASALNEIKQQNLTGGLLLFLVLKKHGNVIGNTPFFLSLSESLHQQSSIEGFGLQVSYHQPGDDVQKYLQSLCVNNYEGILVLATEADEQDIREIRALDKPMVVLDSWFPAENVDCVLMDNADGIEQAMRHAYSLGHRDIGFLRSGVHANNFDERYWAYRMCIERMGLPYRPEFVFSVHSTVDGAYRDMSAILADKPALPSVLVCSNDIIAMGAMDAMNKFGYAIPQDVSFIGFDDMQVSAHLNPPLTSVRIYNRRIANMAVELLAAKIRDKNRCAENIRCLVGVDLKIRDSVAAVEV